MCVHSDKLQLCCLIEDNELLPRGVNAGDNGLILTVVSSDRLGQAAAYCQLIHQHQPWILATKAPSLILDNSTKQSDSVLLIYFTSWRQPAN